MDSGPHADRDEDPIEKLRVIGKEVERAVAVAKRVVRKLNRRSLLPTILR
jgi:hypothetical protein